MIKTFSSLDKTHCQKGLNLKVPYFVTEVIFGQKCINLKSFYFSNNMLSVFFETRLNLGLYTKAYLNYNQVLILHCNVHSQKRW